MRVSRAVLLGVAAWLAVVAVGSTAVWFVISSAGENVGTAEDTSPQAAATLRGPVTPGAQRTHRPAHPLHSPTASPTGPTTAPHATAPATSLSSPSTTSPPARLRTWVGLGGAVTAKCRGVTISFMSAQPDRGFAVEVGDKGPVTVEVHFTGHEDQSGRQSEVTARCLAGVPRFANQSQGGGGGGDE